MVLISPFTKRMNGKKNAKEYPWWPELIKLIRFGKTPNEHIVQIGLKGDEQFVEDFRTNLSLKAIEQLTKECDYWVSIDSFLPHLVHQSGGKRGIVIFGTGSTKLFGYPENINIIKGINYIRKNPYNFWWDEPYNPDVFVSPEFIYETIKENFHDKNSNSSN